MKVSELIEKLKQFDPGAVVVLSSDAEGNSYNELSAAGGMMFRANDDDENEIRYTEAYAEAHGYGEEDTGTEELGFVPAVVLWP